MKFPCALAKGLTCRPLVVTAKDMLDRDETRHRRAGRRKGAS